MKSIVAILILGALLLTSGDRQSEALGVIKMSPGVFAVDAETFTVTIESSTYLFKVKDDRLVLQEGSDLYSARVPGNISRFNIKGRARVGVFRRVELNGP
jgi:hypothetical protein